MVWQRGLPIIRPALGFKGGYESEKLIFDFIMQSIKLFEVCI